MEEEKCVRFENGLHFEFKIQLFLDQFVIVSIDNILVYSKTEPEHDEHLKKKLYAKLSYYRRFLKGFSLIATTLTKLLAKDVPLKWTDEQQSSFQKLKVVLTHAPMLIQSKSRKEYMLKQHECNYSIHDLKLATAIFALKFWRHYLYGEKYYVYTDHKSLKYHLNQNNLNLRLWIELLKDYDCVFEYHPEKANVVASALSRKQMTDLRVVFARLSLVDDRGLLAKMQMEPTLANEIKGEEPLDVSLFPRITQVENDKTEDFEFNDEGIMCFFRRYYVPNDKDLR
ncbi:integrase [Gossypium australe]|uniref:Integrase n=1 Tax=Gossypium australe TaxID=47621 RepID=A0A5B6WQK9_9ROSI|nr:integrase [Gossypium australe]